MLFDPPDKLIGRLRIAQIDIFELSASRNKVDMRVIKSWQNETFTAVDDLSFRAAPRVDLFLLANCNNSVSQDGNRLRNRILCIDRPDATVCYDQISGRTRIGTANCASTKQQDPGKNLWCRVHSTVTA